MMAKSVSSPRGCGPATMKPDTPRDAGGDFERLRHRVGGNERIPHLRHAGGRRRGVMGAAASSSTAPAPKVVVKDTVGAGDAFMAGLMVGLTRGTDTRKVLENACRLGAYVASHNGATPLFPPEITAGFRNA